jgi:hypothetical protein
MVQVATDSVASFASARGKRFSAIGIALDWSLPVGMEYLRGFERFDEVLIGSNWLNTGVIRYVWRDLPGPPSLPQLIVIERTIDAGDKLAIGPERVLIRAVGKEQLSEFSTALLRQ